MKAFNISDSAYYRYRYLLGYGVYALVLGAMLSLAISDVPNGISRSEADSAVQSATMSLASLKEGHIIDAPYHLLQKLSLHYFGITTLGIRLPSVILGMVMGLLLALMLKRWFRTNVAVLTGILTATSVPFMTMGRVGTPMIMGAFWMVALLLGVTHTLHDGPRRFFWKLFSVTALALSLYTPLALYPLVALMTAGLLHPHVRYVIRKVSPLRKAIASVLVIGLLLPLAWAAIRHPANFAVLLLSLIHI